MGEYYHNLIMPVLFPFLFIVAGNKHDCYKEKQDFLHHKFFVHFNFACVVFDLIHYYSRITLSIPWMASLNSTVQYPALPLSHASLHWLYPWEKSGRLS